MCLTSITLCERRAILKIRCTQPSSSFKLLQKVAHEVLGLIFSGNVRKNQDMKTTRNPSDFFRKNISSSTMCIFLWYYYPLNWIAKLSIKPLHTLHCVCKKLIFLGGYGLFFCFSCFILFFLKFQKWLLHLVFLLMTVNHFRAGVWGSACGTVFLILHPATFHSSHLASFVDICTLSPCHHFFPPYPISPSWTNALFMFSSFERW